MWIIALLIITVIMIALNFFVVKKSEEGVSDSIIKKSKLLKNKKGTRKSFLLWKKQY